MSSSDTEQLVADCPLFHGMLKAESDQVVNLLEFQEFEPGETILQEGRSIQAIWVLAEGRCKVFKDTKTGGHRDLAILEPPNTFGEMSFFNPAPHSASVQALSEVKVARLDREKYESLIILGSQAAFKVAFNTIGVLAERLRTMDEWICDLVECEDAVSDHHQKEWGDFRAKLYSEWSF